MPYEVDFENAPTASAPAQEVDVTDQLSPDLDLSTFSFTGVGFGDTRIAIPEGTQYFATTVPMTYNSETFNVEIELGLNLSTGQVYAHFLSVDPAKDLPPDVLTGFLPPEDGTGRGMGYFDYTVNPVAGLATGTPITNVAVISFDRQQTIATDQVNDDDPSQGIDPTREALVTIDSGPPTSSVNPLPSTTAATSFTVAMSGTDDAGGSGIATFALYVSTNGGPFVLDQSGIPAQAGTGTAFTGSTLFTGVTGDTYAFSSVATDNVGNVEAAHATFDTETTLVAATLPAAPSNLAITPNSGNQPGFTNTGTVTLTGSLNEANLAVDVYDAKVGADLGAAIVNGTSFSLPLNLSAGIHQLKVTATDAENNPSAPGLFTINVDETPPKATLAAIPSPRTTAVASESIVFSKAINPATLSWQDFTLSLNGGPNLITSDNITITPVPNSNTYTLSGLGGLTATDGFYVLTLLTNQISAAAGNAGVGSNATSWLVDTLAPASQVSPLPHEESALDFPVPATGTDPAPAPGVPSSGIVSYYLYVSDNGAPFTFWTTVPASSLMATYPGQSGHTYAFYSVATDAAGNVESKSPLVEASTYVPDLTPPVTEVTAVDDTTPSFVVSWSGFNPDGMRMTNFALYVQVDGKPPALVGDFPASTPNAMGVSTGSTTYQAITDGAPHTYTFSTIGTNSDGIAETAPAGPGAGAGATVSATFAAQAATNVTGFIVQNGAVERSSIRYLDVQFNQSQAALTALLDMCQIELELVQHQLDGVARSTDPTMVIPTSSLIVLDHAIEIDFGPGGIGGNPTSISGDGYYELDVLLPGGQETTLHFYRLLGDVNGDGTVDNNDITIITAALGESGTGLDADVDGSGSVNSSDRILAMRSRGRALAPGLKRDD
jgi:hypothetical protein